MGFLAPAALALAAAIAVPIILHLFQRQQGPRLIFPALRYLRRAEKEHARRIKLRQFLLLALRVLAVLLIAIIAARPFLRSGGNAHAPSAVVIVLDNSASSATVIGDQRIIDGLKQRAIETLMRAGPDDRFWLLRAGSPWEPATRGDAATIADRVRETEPTPGAANLRAALERGASLLAAGADGRAQEIHLLSDLQTSNLRGVAAQPRNDPAVVIWSPRRNPIGNQGVSDIEISGGLAPRTGERATVAVRVDGTTESDSAHIRLAVGARTAAAAIATVGSAAVLQLPPQAEGFLSGFAEIDADALRLDDRRYFALNVTPVPTVGIGRTASYVDEALNVMSDARRIQRTAPAGANIVVAPGGAGLESARPDATVIVLPPDNAIELPAINRRLAAAGIGWRYATNAAAGEARFANEASTADPLLRHLAAVQLRLTYALQPPGGATTDSVVLRLTDGSPWAVRGERASGGRFVLLATPLTLEASTLPTSAAMVPLLDRMLGAWSARSSTFADVAPAEVLQLPRDAAAVIKPDNSRDTVAVGEVYRAPPDPGVYRVLNRAGQQVSAFVVNTSPVESQLIPASARRVRASLDGWDLEFADSPGEWLRDIYRERLGRELWWPLLLALLLVMLSESIIAAAGRNARTVGADIPSTSTPDKITV